MRSINSAILKWMNVIAFIFTVLVNSLAGSTTIIGGQNTAQISDNNPTLITPAGYVFSIWGIIYFLLGVFVVFQALPSEKGKDYQKRIGLLFILGSLFNIVWLFLWQYELLTFSVVLMFLLLATLMTIYMRLEIGKSSVSLRERMAVHLPFSVYLGWITIAAIENVAVTLVSVDWGGLGLVLDTWATLIMIIAILIAVFVTATRRDLAYGLVIIWALVGIIVKQSNNQKIVLTGQLGAIIMAITVIATVIFPRLKRQ